MEGRYDGRTRKWSFNGQPTKQPLCCISGHPIQRSAGQLLQMHSSLCPPCTRECDPSVTAISAPDRLEGQQQCPANSCAGKKRRADAHLRRPPVHRGGSCNQPVVHSQKTKRSHQCGMPYTNMCAASTSALELFDHRIVPIHFALQNCMGPMHLRSISTSAKAFHLGQ